MNPCWQLAGQPGKRAAGDEGNVMCCRPRISSSWWSGALVVDVGDVMADGGRHVSGVSVRKLGGN